MAIFERGIPVSTELPGVVVENGFKPGLHRFSLVVVDERGRESMPDVRVVEVSDTVTPLIVPTRPVAAVRRKPRTRSTP
jgi:hypothetical protein